MLEVALRRTNGNSQVPRGHGAFPWTWVQGDAFFLPVPDTQIDLVYTVRFIKHFCLPDRRRLYAEILRVLKPGGLFILEAQNRKVSLPHRLSKGLDKYPIYDELYDRTELVAELESERFGVKEMQGVLNHFEWQVCLNRLRRFRLEGLSYYLIRALERLQGEPNTWMVLCQKR